MKTIFVIDDSDTCLSVAEEALGGQYRVMTMASVVRAFSLLEKIKPDLILLDVEMPEMNGLEAIKHLKNHKSYCDIPVIFITGRSDSATEAACLELGAVDFITKPFSTHVLLNRIRAHLELDSLIHERTSKILLMQKGIVSVLAELINRRSKTAGGHSIRTTAYMKILITAMKQLGVYADELEKWDIDIITSSACLHDVGKIGLPDSLLNKKNITNVIESTEMKTHITMGEEIIDRIISLSGRMEFLDNARIFISSHHELWDGSGYPRGLKGLDIPLQGRILAVADTYDELVIKQFEKGSTDFEEVENKIIRDSGTLYDPAIIDAFVKTKNVLREMVILLYE